MTHPLSIKDNFSKSANATLLLYPAVAAGVNMLGMGYSSSVGRARNIGKNLYHAVTAAGPDEPPLQKFVDAAMTRKILDMSEEELKELQADILAEHIYRNQMKKKR